MNSGSPDPHTSLSIISADKVETSSATIRTMEDHQQQLFPHPSHRSTGVDVPGKFKRWNLRFWG